MPCRPLTILAVALALSKVHLCQDPLCRHQRLGLSSWAGQKGSGLFWVMEEQALKWDKFQTRDGKAGGKHQLPSSFHIWLAFFSFKQRSR